MVFMPIPFKYLLSSTLFCCAVIESVPAINAINSKMYFYLFILKN